MCIRVAVDLVRFGFVPWYGVMPSGYLLLDLVSRVWWWSSLSPTSPLWWRGLVDIRSDSIPPNKLTYAQHLGDVVVLSSVSCRRGDGNRKVERSRLGLLSWCWASPDPSFRRRWCYPRIWERASGISLEAGDGDPELIRWWLWRSYDTGLLQQSIDSSGRRAAILVPHGHDARREAVLCQIGVCDLLQRSRHQVVRPPCRR